VNILRVIFIVAINKIILDRRALNYNWFLLIWWQVENDVFFNEFIYHVKFFLIVFKREPSVERGIDFIAKFSTSLQTTSKQSTEDQDTEVADTSMQDDMHPFLVQLFNFLLKVKYRCILLEYACNDYHVFCYVLPTWQASVLVLLS